MRLRLPKLLPGVGRSVMLRNALKLRAAGLSRKAAVSRALKPLRLKLRPSGSVESDVNAANVDKPTANTIRPPSLETSLE